MLVMLFPGLWASQWAPMGLYTSLNQKKAKSGVSCIKVKKISLDRPNWNKWKSEKHYRISGRPMRLTITLTKAKQYQASRFIVFTAGPAIRRMAKVMVYVFHH